MPYEEYEETEADRIVRERKRRREAGPDLTRYKVEGSDDPWKDKISQLEKEISTVLQLLAQLGYPDMQEVYCGPDMPQGSVETDIKAGWEIGMYPYKLYGEDVNDRIYLLSDGAIKRESMQGSGAYPQEIYRLIKGSLRSIPFIKRAEPGIYAYWTELIPLCLTGVRDLRRKLEESRRSLSSSGSADLHKP